MVTLCLAGGTAVLAEESPVDGNALLDRVISQPGEFYQMCSSPPPVSPSVPFPIYRLVLYREMYPSPGDITELKAHRDAVVAALVSRLEAIDFSKAPPPAPPLKLKKGEEAVEESGISPRILSGLMFEIILALDLVEALPQLLQKEDDLRARIAAAEVNPKAPAPVVTTDGTVVYGHEEITERGEMKYKVYEDLQLSKRDNQLYKARILQREMLSVMLKLLRNQRFEPVLKSDLEKKYEAAIRARANEEDLRAIKTPEDAKAKDAGDIQFDPIIKVPLGFLRKPPTTPFTRELREEIRGYVQAYLKTKQ